MTQLPFDVRERSHLDERPVLHPLFPERNGVGDERIPALNDPVPFEEGDAVCDDVHDGKSLSACSMVAASQVAVEGEGVDGAARVYDRGGVMRRKDPRDASAHDDGLLLGEELPHHVVQLPLAVLEEEVLISSAGRRIRARPFRTP